ncbi:hypothetical protein Q8A64_06580 [Oxalobacteraceae bacterium R-40]|uniref:Uncharacterized protein n=1 Tax=Keguizhuia sedimenti TaxID=3064264 RepID=A0ABU1BM68_9BURK|nr:hypothetical protein [Oxalobacteraceae bacterium R-40]
MPAAPELPEESEEELELPSPLEPELPVAPLVAPLSMLPEPMLLEPELPLIPDEPPLIPELSLLVAPALGDELVEPDMPEPTEDDWA